MGEGTAANCFSSVFLCTVNYFKENKITINATETYCHVSLPQQ